MNFFKSKHTGNVAHKNDWLMMFKYREHVMMYDKDPETYFREKIEDGTLIKCDRLGNEIKGLK